MIELKHVSRTGRQQEQLLRDISLTISPGQQLAISGPSGSGKSLLLRAIARLDALSDGELLFCGEQVSPSDTPQYRSKVMYLHQQPAMLEGTVRTNLQHAFGFRIHRGRSLSENAATELLTRMGRTDSLMSRSSSHLSGGERQIVALVRALVLQPRVLLLDEATSALDEASALLVEQVIAEWVEAEPPSSDASRAVVWVTHSQAQQQRVATRVVQIKEGRLQ